MKTNLKKEIAGLAIFLVVIFLFVVFASRLFIPKRTNFGSTWETYLQEEQNSLDVLFFGSSITYCDVVPAVIWESSGVSSYVIGGPEQTIPISYYYIKEACKTQTPEMVFLEVTGAYFKQYQDFTKVNIGYMPWGKNRLDATFAAAERSEWPGLFFPIYNYHGRWDSLEKSDFGYTLMGYPPDDLAGYTFLNTAEEMTQVIPRGEEYDGENYSRNIEYLRKIADFCVENGIKPVFYLAPTYWRLSDNNLARLKGDISAIEGVDLIDFNQSPGLDVFDGKTDFYDKLHFNCFGAEKYSAGLGQLLKTQYKLAPTENADQALWNQRLQKFKELRG